MMDPTCDRFSAGRGDHDVASRPSHSRISGASNPIAIPSDPCHDQISVLKSLDQVQCKWGVSRLLTSAAAAKSQSYSGGSSTYSHVSDQSSAGFFFTDLDIEVEDQRPLLGSWATRQTHFSAAALHLPVQVPKVSKSKQAANLRSDTDAAWRFRFKHKWRREQLKRLGSEQGFLASGVGYEDGGWEAAMHLLGAVAREVGVNLDAWAALAAGGGPSSTGGAGNDTHLGAADAALALDEELSGRPLSALSISGHQGRPVHWSPGMGAATVVTLEGATPEFKIRRVTMRGGSVSKLTPLAVPKVAAPLPFPPSTISSDYWEETDKLKMLASQQLAILKATDDALRPSPRRDLDWVGNHVVSTEVDGSGSAGGIPYITVQLTDPATGATRVVVRGAHGARQSHLMSTLKNQVKHAAAMHQLPAPQLQLLDSGLLAV